MTICDRLLLCGSRLCTSSNNATPLVYLVRLSTTSTTFVTRVMGSANVESDLRAALASAPLTDAALGDVITNVLSIINDAIEPGGLMGMTISSSHTSLQATTNGECERWVPRSSRWRRRALREGSLSPAWRCWCGSWCWCCWGRTKESLRPTRW